MKMQIEPGTIVWVVERDEEDYEPVEVSGYVYICEFKDWVIVSPFINGHGDIPYIMEYHAMRTVTDYESGLCVFSSKDVYQDNVQIYFQGENKLLPKLRRENGRNEGRCMTN